MRHVSYITKDRNLGLADAFEISFAGIRSVATPLLSGIESNGHVSDSDVRHNQIDGTRETSS